MYERIELEKLIPSEIKYQFLGRALQRPLLTYYLEFSQISQNKK